MSIKNPQEDQNVRVSVCVCMCVCACVCICVLSLKKFLQGLVVYVRGKQGFFLFFLLYVCIT